jgi:adenylate cyclase
MTQQSSATPPTAPGYRVEFEAYPRRVKVVFGGVVIADTERAIVLRETRLAPTFYLPREDVRMDLMVPTDYRTHCPFKGNAHYWTLTVGDKTVENAVWSYENPLPEALPIKGMMAFYRNRMDAWYDADQEVQIDPVTDVHDHGNPLVDWLMRDAWEASSISELVARLARQLVAVGIPVFRLNLMIRTLHPQVMGTGHVWSHDTNEVEERVLAHWRATEEAFLESPFTPIFHGRGGVRRRLEGPDARLDFPVLRDLRNQGATDYAAMPLTFSDGQIHAITLATRAPGGFATDALGHLHEILPVVSRLVEVHSLRRTARTLLDTYLGVHTGGRVLDGLIRRGDGENIPAVIWWCDLRGSTGLAERLPRQDYLRLLNDFFEASAGSVLRHGGEVLKFIGDAVMAIFPTGDAPDAPARALAAVHEALDRVAEATARRAEAGEPSIQVALALHHGEVTYGNVGVPGRLDFTVTGPAVNEVARLEGLSKQLGHPVVASAAFAGLMPEEMVSLGRHALRGVSAEHEVFTLRA